MSSKLLGGVAKNAWDNARRMLLASTYTNTSAFRLSVRNYQFTSYPSYDMTKYDANSSNPMGCYLPAERKEALHQKILDVLGATREQDRMSRTALEAVTGTDNYEDIIDEHGGLDPDDPKKDIEATVHKVTIGENGQREFTEAKLIQPRQLADPTLSLDGFVGNATNSNQEKDIRRNLDFVAGFEDLIADGPGELAYVLQFFQARSPISFDLLNFILGDRYENKLTEEELQKENTVKGYVDEYLESILPGSSKNFQIDMEKKTISAVQFMSVHSSLILKYPMANGKNGYIGCEIGRPSFSYIEGQLVKNAHQQVVDPAVAQTMNISKMSPNKLPLSVDELRKNDPEGITRDNFYKRAELVPCEAIEDSKKPSFPDFNLYTGTKVTREKERDFYLSEGVPIGVNKLTVPNAKTLAKTLYFITGRYRDHALRLGSYFAHVAKRGQDRACPILALFGSDLAGSSPKELFPILEHVKQYDFSQQMRESMLQNLLFMELQARDSGKTNEVTDFAIYSESTAHNFLDMALNGYVTMQIYKEAWDIAERNPNDDEAKKMKEKLDRETIDFKNRYRNLWQNAAFTVLNLHRIYGVGVLLDRDDNGSAKTSVATEYVVKMVAEKLVEMETELAEAIRVKEQNEETNEFIEFDVDTSVQEFSLKIGTRAKAGLEGILKEVSDLN